MNMLDIFLAMKMSVAGLFRLTVTEVVEEESGLFSPDQMAGYAVTALFVVIGLGVTYLIIKKFLFKPIVKLMDQRKDAVMTELADAAEQSSRAESLLKDADKSIADAKEEAEKILADARVQAEKNVRLLMANAETEVAEKIEKAEREIKHLQVIMIEKMREEIVDLAVSIAGKIVSDTVDAKQMYKLAQEVVEERLASDKSRENRGENCD